MNQKILWKIESLRNHYFVEKNRKKINISDCYKDNTSIYNPDFRCVNEFDFSESKDVVHSDDYGKYYGLQYSQVLEVNGRLVYLFDNHNKILQSFLEYYEILGESFDVVHIDAHPDDAVFMQEKLRKLQLKNVKSYIEQTRISDFFDFLSKSKIINNIHRYTKSSDFKEFKIPQNPYILSLDIDIFGEEGDFVDLESKIRVIAQAWSDAEIVCIAMSPGFINQEFAQEIINIFTKREISE